jgi:hypothetical protein
MAGAGRWLGHSTQARKPATSTASPPNTQISRRRIFNPGSLARGRL